MWCVRKKWVRKKIAMASASGKNEVGGSGERDEARIQKKKDTIKKRRTGFKKISPGAS